MSLVKDKFWIDPSALDFPRAVQRRKVFDAVLVRVVSGAGPGGALLSALFTEHFTNRPGYADEAALFYAAELPGTWHVISESWQGTDRGHFFCKVLYVDRETDTACLVEADLDEESGEEPECDSIWLSLAELRAFGAIPIGPLPEQQPENFPTDAHLPSTPTSEPESRAVLQSDSLPPRRPPG